MIKTTGFLAVLGLLLYGQAEMPMAEWSHLPAAGLLGFLLWWIVTKQQPKEHKENREHLEKERKEDRVHLERVVQQIGSDSKEIQQQQHEDSKAIVNKIGLLADNCASHLAQNTVKREK